MVTAPSIESRLGSEEDAGTHSSGVARLRRLPPLFWFVSAVTLIQLTLRTWSAWGGWFHADDFWWHDLVEATTPTELMTMSLGGHFSPLTYLLNDALTTTFPYNWESRVLVMMAGMLIANVGAFLLARQLWPDRTAPVAAFFLLFAFTPFAAPNFLWYSQFGVGGVQIICGVWFAWSVARALRRPTLQGYSLAVALGATALLVSERAILSAPITIVLLLLAMGCIPDRKRAREALVRYRGLWLGMGLLIALYVPLYLANAEELPGTGNLDLGAIPVAVANGLVNTVIPAVIGGPWVFDPSTIVGQVAAPGVLVLLSCLAVPALAYVSIRRDPRAAILWLFLAASSVAACTLVAIGRLETVGASALTELRYFPDFAIIVPLVIVASFCPCTTVVVSPDKDHHPERTLSFTRPAVVVLALFLTSSCITQVALGARWHGGVAGDFYDKLQTSIAGRSPMVIDRQMPSSVITPVLLDQTLASRALSIVKPRIRFDEVSTSPWWIADSGELVPAAVIDGRVALPGPNGECGYLLASDSPAVVVFDDDAFDWKWWLRLDYFSTTTNEVVIAAGADSVTATLPAGVHSAYTPLAGKFSEVEVQMRTPGSVACITAAQIGEPGPSVSPSSSRQ